MMLRHTKLWCCVLGVGLLSLAGCATVGPADAGADSKAVVTARVQERWNAMINNNMGTAYGFFSPATRQIMPIAVFQGKVKPGIWRAVKVKSVTCEQDLCKAAVLLTYDLRDIKGLEQELEETWIKEEGSWWYVPKK